jgi:hypothetical protein
LRIPDVLVRHNLERRVRHSNALPQLGVHCRDSPTGCSSETLTSAHRTCFFPSGTPAQPILLSLTDNIAVAKLSNKFTSTSLQGQQLIGIIAELQRTRNLGLNARHIPGVENIIADYISRGHRFRMHASARTWTISCRVQNFYRASLALFKVHQLGDCQVFQRSWDASFPSAELGHRPLRNVSSTTTRLASTRQVRAVSWNGQ